MERFIHHRVLAYLLILPQLIITLLFFVWPAVGALSESFYFGDAFGIHKQFAGFTNFIDLLHDPSFIKAIGVSFLTAALVTLFTMLFGLLLASLIKNSGKSQVIYKPLMIWPYAVAPAVAAILWRFLLQPPLGWIPHVLHLVGIEFNYLVHPLQAITVIILTASWQQFSYNFLFFLAALNAIPPALLEAAKLDGAGAWRRFWQIIFPLISPTTFFLLIMNVIYAFFDTFGIIDILTHGGPGNTTTTVIYKIYQDGFINMDLGSAAAQSVILMIMLIGITLFQFHYIEKKVHYR